MKIFVVEGNYPQYNIIDGASLDDKMERPKTAINLLPDTALLMRGRPFFVPDFAWPCTVQLHGVVRIARLGKNIAPRFAYRYYDAVSVGATFTAAQLWASLRASGLPWDKAKSFDGACSLGTFQTLSEEERKDLSGCIDLSINEQVVQSADLKDMLCSIDDIIAAISRYHKLCQGDLIYCGTPAEGSLVQLDDHIVGRWRNKPLLAFNVK